MPTIPSLVRRLGYAIGACAIGFAHPVFAAESAKPTSAIDGLWNGTVQLKDGAIPFRFRISGGDSDIRITYFDGARPVDMSANGHLAGDILDVDFPSIASHLNAKLDQAGLHGSIGALPFEAQRLPRKIERPNAASSAPAIAGTWEVPIDSNKGEKAWRLIVHETPAEVDATILRIDGDTGTISGRYDGAHFNLSRFAGERPASLQITPKPDGTLSLVLIDQFGRRDLTALRPDAARQSGMASPDDPHTHTGVADAAQVFHFSGTDLAGNVVTNADPRFAGKVVLLNIMGSWCPNCHDEAPFLAELDKKYRDRGLQVVSLDFEDAAALKDLARLKAFIARYGLAYTVLVGGERAQVNEKLPQAVHLDAWPTTFFIGRDGAVHDVHVGFPSAGSGDYDRQARAEITKEVETLLDAQTASRVR